MFDVIISGGGPTGMMLAAELRLHGVAVLVLERDAAPSPVARALGLHSRSVELLAQRGILDRFLAEGTRYPGAPSLAGITPPTPARLDGPYDYILGIAQPITDRLLTERAVELGAELRRGAEVTGFTQDADGVTVDVAADDPVRGRWLVGCDGGRSLVRKTLGIPFPGEAAQTEWLLAEIEVTTPASEISAISEEVRKTHRGFGIGPAGPAQPTLFRAVVPAADVSENRTVPPTLDEFRTQLRAYAGTDFGAHDPRWLSRFTDATRLADRYRDGRVLLAGDAAHVHPPLGGQGLNLGIQDAANLGFKLAATVNGWAPVSLLDTYETERRPVADDVLALTRAQSVLIAPESGPQAVRRLLADLMEFTEVSDYLTGRITGTGIRYDFDEPGDMVGRRILDLQLSEGGVYDRLQRARGLLIDRTGRLDVSGWADRVDVVADESVALEPSAALVRPDGYVVWVGADQWDLAVHLRRWFGETATAERGLTA